jgi:hypothetical protein
MREHIDFFEVETELIQKLSHGDKLSWQNVRITPGDHPPAHIDVPGPVRIAPPP